MRQYLARLSALTGIIALGLGGASTPTSVPAPAQHHLSWTAGLPVPCAATPLEPAPFHRRDLRPLPWITASPAAVGLTGHLFFAMIPGIHVVRVGRQGRAAVLHTGGVLPGKGGGAMKILWVLENPRASDVLSPLTIVGRKLNGAGTTHQVFPRAGAAEYPSIIVISTPGCWQLHLQIRSLAADRARFEATATMIVVG
jgi:hypothetical protein